MNHRTLVRVGLLTASVACHREASTAAGAGPSAGTTSTARDASGAGGPAGVIGQRCHPTEQRIALEGRVGAGDVSLGDGLAYGGGVAVGLLHRTDAGYQAAVVSVDEDGRNATVHDLTPSFGDAPPPRLVSCGGVLLAAALRPPALKGEAVGFAGGICELAVYGLGANGANGAEPTGVTIPQHRDDSLAFDLACSGDSISAVWDETVPARAGAPARGVVRGASFGLRTTATGVRDVSPPTSDAEGPRIVREGDGFLVFWLAHRAASEGAGAADAVAVIEMAGEARAYGWLEMQLVDRTGAPTGPLRRLTPTSGHISAYDVFARTDPHKGEVLVVARDDEEAAEGVGGSLLRVRVRADCRSDPKANECVEPPASVPTDGLGRGSPSFVTAEAPWLSWVGPREQSRLLPLDLAGEVAGPPSAEDGMDDARPLLALAPPARGGDPEETRVLVATAANADRSAELRVFVCHP